MDNRRYQVLANGYTCVAADSKTMVECLSRHLSSGRKRLSEARIREMKDLEKWGEKSEAGKYLVTDDYTVRILDSKRLREEGCY